MTSKVTTFYSYKGGSGRSMTMANVAWALATNGEKVLTIDWDLEAPGLHRYFHPFLDDPSQARYLGLVDHIWRYILALADPEKADSAGELAPGDELVQELQLPLEGPGCLHFIGAGRQDDHYSDKVGGLDWSSFYGRFGGERFLDSFMAWAKERYTHILIDSRTGVADTAGLCTTQLPDALVMCLVYNRQSIEGTAAVARSIVRTRAQRGQPRVEMIITPSRVEDRSAVTSARRHCVESLQGILRLPTARLAHELRRSEIRHFPWCSFEEKLAVFEEIPDDSGSLLDAMHNLAGRISERKLTAVELDPAIISYFWRRAAFDDPRLAELEALSGAPNSEVIAKLTHWLDDALDEPQERTDWTGALALACVEQANALNDTDSRASDFLSEKGFELAKRAYEQDRRGYRIRFAAALQGRADHLQRLGRYEEALRAAGEAVDIYKSDGSTSSAWRHARGYERLAELTLASRGNEAALPLYQKMVELFDRFEDLDGLRVPAGFLGDALRARRLLAERHVQAGDYEAALHVLERAMAILRGGREMRNSRSSEAANVLGLYAEVAAVVHPERARAIVEEVKSLAAHLLDARALTSILERRLAIVETDALVRRNDWSEALAVIEKLEFEDSLLYHSADAQLPETAEMRALALLKLGRATETEVLLSQLIQQSSRAPSPRLCELVLETIRATGNPQLLYDLVLKRAGPNQEPHEPQLLRHMLSSAMEFMTEDRHPVLMFLQETLERSRSRSLSTGML